MRHLPRFEPATPPAPLPAPELIDDLKTIELVGEHRRHPGVMLPLTRFEDRQRRKRASDGILHDEDLTRSDRSDLAEIRCALGLPA